jgi:hypothetical protein
MQGDQHPEIGWQAAYAQIIDPNRQGPFSLMIIKSGGKEIGQKRRLMRCLYGKKPGSGKTRSQRQAEKVAAKLDKSKISATERRLHVWNGTIPIFDVEQNRYISPLMSHITEFNQYKVIH